MDPSQSTRLAIGGLSLHLQRRGGLRFASQRPNDSPFFGVSENGGTPKMDGLWKTLFKWMIWGYPYFWKHPSFINETTTFLKTSLNNTFVLQK